MESFNEWIGLVDSPWKFLMGVGVLTLGPFALLSKETVSEKFWLIGSVTRYFRERKEKAADLEEQLASRRTEDLWREINRVDDLRIQDREKFEKRVASLEQSDRDKYEYILYVTAVWRTILLWAADEGHILPVQVLTFEQWLQQGRGADATTVEDGSGLADG